LLVFAYPDTIHKNQIFIKNFSPYCSGFEAIFSLIVTVIVIKIFDENKYLGAQKKGDHRAPNRKVMIAIITKIITRIFAISIENPATPLAPNI